MPRGSCQDAVGAPARGRDDGLRDRQLGALEQHDRAARSDRVDQDARRGPQEAKAHDPIDVAPQLSRAADQLRAEHKELYLDFCEVVERAERMFYDEQHAALALWIGPEFLEFDVRLRSHEERENDLIMEAYDGDIGVGD